MNRYKILLQWSDEDSAFIAEVPGLPGCMAHDDSYEAVLVNVKDAMELWLEVAREYKHEIPDPTGMEVAL